ncbi:hypothetical protein ATO3_28085 [Marinibacterium profundimaris]|uniref:Uncharacterized protein n=1 Tax=Marinibacterium profundimaris TaxID=1679460 RepID=A0A225NGY6_9RHOB|nr:hypothetical protein ATO3_28085 [Marinibacterium profundimaris]
MNLLRIAPILLNMIIYPFSRGRDVCGLSRVSPIRVQPIANRNKDDPITIIQGRFVGVIAFITNRPCATMHKHQDWQQPLVLVGWNIQIQLLSRVIAVSNIIIA